MAVNFGLTGNLSLIISDKYLIVRTIASSDDLLCKNTGKVFDLVEWM